MLEQNHVTQLLLTLLYSGVGVVVFIIAFWLVGRLTPFSVRKEIEDDHNVALGIVLGSIIIGLAIIIAAAIIG